MTSTIRIRAKRAFYALGQLFEVGAIRSFDPLTAADLIAGGRGELVDVADEPRLRAAVEAAAVAAVSTLPRDSTRGGPRGYI